MDNRNLKTELRYVVLRIYPHSNILRVTRYKNYHSDTFRLTLFDKDVNKFREILLKKYRTKPYSQTYTEFCNQLFFYSMSNGAIYSAPKPMLVDEETNTIVMEYIPGKSIKSFLLDKPTQGQINEYMNHSADLLFTYHCTCVVSDGSKLNVESPTFGKINREELSATYMKFDSMNLKVAIKPFLDFSPWNILFFDDHYYLIDFPECNSVCTPHIDLARFIFCLNVIKHTPMVTRLRLEQGWDQFIASRQFFERYAMRHNVVLNDADFELIKYFYEKDVAALMKNMKGSPRFIERVQYQYLKDKIIAGFMGNYFRQRRGRLLGF
mgnify:CR=1 FL=1